MFPHQSVGLKAVINAVHHWRQFLNQTHVIFAMNNFPEAACIGCFGGMNSAGMLQVMFQLWGGRIHQGKTHPRSDKCAGRNIVHTTTIEWLLHPEFFKWVCLIIVHGLTWCKHFLSSRMSMTQKTSPWALKHYGTNLIRLFLSCNQSFSRDISKNIISG